MSLFSGLGDLLGDAAAPIGAGLGFLAGGPTGAAIGASIGGGLAQGAAGEEATAAQLAAQEQARQDYLAGVNRAQENLMNLFPQASQMLGGGYRDAFNLMQQATPAQMQMAQQGNVNAQQTLLNSLPQMQNAILGGAIDYSALGGPQSVNVDTSFLQNAQAPTGQLDFSQLLGGQAPTQNQALQDMIERINLNAVGNFSNLFGNGKVNLPGMEDMNPMLPPPTGEAPAPVAPPVSTGTFTPADPTTQTPIVGDASGWVAPTPQMPSITPLEEFPALTIGGVGGPVNPITNISGLNQQNATGGLLGGVGLPPNFLELMSQVNQG